MSSPYQPRIPMGQLHDKLSAILTICQQMNSVRDLGALLDLVAREAARLLDADRASIFLLDREKMELWSKVALGSDDIIRFDAPRALPAQPLSPEKSSTSATPTTTLDSIPPSTTRRAIAHATCWRSRFRTSSMVKWSARSKCSIRSTAHSATKTKRCSNRWPRSRR